MARLQVAFGGELFEAFMTVLRDICRESASARVDGRRVPDARFPRRMASRSRSYSWRCNGTEDRGSMGRLMNIAEADCCDMVISSFKSGTIKLAKSGSCIQSMTRRQ